MRVLLVWVANYYLHNFLIWMPSSCSCNHGELLNPVKKENLENVNHSQRYHTNTTSMKKDREATNLDFPEAMAGPIELILRLPLVQNIILHTFKKKNHRLLTFIVIVLYVLLFDLSNFNTTPPVSRRARVRVKYQSLAE